MCRRVEARAQTHMKNYKRKHLSSNPPRPPIPQLDEHHKRGANNNGVVHSYTRDTALKKQNYKKIQNREETIETLNQKLRKKKKITKCKANNKILKTVVRINSSNGGGEKCWGRAKWQTKEQKTTTKFPPY
jgi:predicted RNase H-like nuclease (RuvC/YqgF family)